MHNSLEERIDPLTLKFLDLVVKNKREPYLEAIVRRFIYDYRQFNKVKSVKLITAQPISDTVKDQLLNLIKSHYTGTIELSEYTDESIIGGFILYIEEKQYDASIKSQLERMRESFKEISFSEI